MVLAHGFDCFFSRFLELGNNFSDKIAIDLPVRNFLLNQIHL